MVLCKEKEKNNKLFIRIIAIFIMIIGLISTILFSTYLEEKKLMSNLEKDFTNICLKDGKKTLENHIILLKLQTKNEKLNIFFQKSIDNCLN